MSKRSLSSTVSTVFRLSRFRAPTSRASGSVFIKPDNLRLHTKIKRNAEVLTRRVARLSQKGKDSWNDTLENAVSTASRKEVKGVLQTGQLAIPFKNYATMETSSSSKVVHRTGSYPIAYLVSVPFSITRFLHWIYLRERTKACSMAFR